MKTISSKKQGIFVGAALLLSSLAAFAQESLVSAAPEEAGAFISFPLNHQQVTAGEVEIHFRLKGMGIAPAGIKVDNTGHHHLLINQDINALDLNAPLPSNDNVKHFGKGQTETILDLVPGDYTLQLVLGDHLHQPHNPPVVSEVVNLKVIAVE